MLRILERETYCRLRRQATAALRRWGGAGLEADDLLHDALLRMARSDVRASSEEHLAACAHKALRHALCDGARRRCSKKRGSGHVLEPLSEDTIVDGGGPAELETHDLLRELDRLDPRLAKVATLRVFGGFEIGEIASALEVSKSTVEKDWCRASRWLKHQLASNED
ncbi:MAG: sigma-70 family RNA polymerase sigma factor [Polyangiaceae bacterium]